MKAIAWDDESSKLKELHKYLGFQGVELKYTDDPKEFEQLFENEGPWCCLITDWIYKPSSKKGGGNIPMGARIADIARARQPGLPVFVISAIAEDVNLPRLAGHGPVQVKSKRGGMSWLALDICMNLRALGALPNPRQVVLVSFETLDRNTIYKHLRSRAIEILSFHPKSFAPAVRSGLLNELSTCCAFIIVDPALAKYAENARCETLFAASLMFSSPAALDRTIYITSSVPSSNANWFAELETLTYDKTIAEVLPALDDALTKRGAALRGHSSRSNSPGLRDAPPTRGIADLSVNMTALTQEMRRDFIEVVVSSFSNSDALDKFLRDSLGIDWSLFEKRGRYRNRVTHLVEQAEGKGWLKQLILGMRAAQPGNDKLIAFVKNLGVSAEVTLHEALECTVRTHHRFINPFDWIQRIIAITGQVCRIEITMDNEVRNSTGFLVGPDILLTNYHNVAPLIKGGIAVDRFKAQFDYYLSDSASVGEECISRLAPEYWLIAHSEYSPREKDAFAPAFEDQGDFLDLALLRLDKNIGDQLLPSSKRKRGWISVPEKASLPVPNNPFFIVQHPEGSHLKLAYDADANVKLNKQQTRIRYSINTLKGSSGSPCFDLNWNLMAIHHFGDPDSQNHGFIGKYNQGIPITAIAKFLEKHAIHLPHSEPI